MADRQAYHPGVLPLGQGINLADSALGLRGECSLQDCNSSDKKLKSCTLLYCNIEHDLKLSLSFNDALNQQWRLSGFVFNTFVDVPKGYESQSTSCAIGCDGAVPSMDGCGAKSSAY